MIAYFGRDNTGYFVDSEAGEREYMDEPTWRALVQAGAHAGAKTEGADQPNKARVRLSITERVTVEKFEGDHLIETVHGSPETTAL